MLCDLACHRALIEHDHLLGTIDGRELVRKDFLTLHGIVDDIDLRFGESRRERGDVSARRQWFHRIPECERNPNEQGDQYENLGAGHRMGGRHSFAVGALRLRLFDRGSHLRPDR